MAAKRISFQDAWQLLLTTRASTIPGSVTLPMADVPLLTTLSDGLWTLHAEPADPTTAELIDCFMPFCHPARPSVVFAQVGQSLDGRIATVTGASHYINGEAGLDHLHRLRAMADIVVVGAGTVHADNPRLTVRRVDGPHPDRAVIDPRRRIDPDQAVFDMSSAPTYRLVAGAPNSEHELQVAPDGTPITPGAIVDALRARGYRRIFIEGGSQTVSSFLHAGCLDRLHLIVAPMIIGSGIPALQLPEIDQLDLALRPETKAYTLGSDYLFDMCLRAP
ncbi:hypothetical protein RE428_27390 [Marinobacter nanhaiticus D15-8W]|uniref:5-amino-6-(5-phosphoribosylamino)uracil reductase n=1 Tax=Marinobacter nanhaiticus D15-8W TaxID=626887 RepID=N6WZW3_9GAMM|nr:RibD family protein [Marinobacter nanhaiticus]ENO14333.1 5-amino-6-(5-phosphoribosylamino)uracil reductase [Marinobacter nanhaiticus D15-8W]BES71721.1 hypothetical protein RE428_27390 [Marinobacter nanhaiticus D15-8W]